MRRNWKRATTSEIDHWQGKTKREFDLRPTGCLHVLYLRSEWTRLFTWLPPCIPRLDSWLGIHMHTACGRLQQRHHFTPMVGRHCESATRMITYCSQGACEVHHRALGIPTCKASNFRRRNGCPTVRFRFRIFRTNPGQ
jgi:hypothetical protein